MPLVKRLIKGSTLTYQEMDDNLSYLDNKVSGSDGYILKYSGSNSTTSSRLNEIGSTVFVYGSLNVSQSLTVGGVSITPNSPSYFIATGSATASVDVNNAQIFSIFYNGVNCGRINANLANTSYGDTTLKYTTTGINNSAFGTGTLNSNTSGYDNTAIGYWSLIQNTAGFYNTAIGSTALQANTIGYGNTALGFGALKANTNGDTNVAVGGNALEFSTTGSDNTAIGTSALNFNVNSNNTALGSAAGLDNITGSGNVFLGYRAGYSETNSNKLYIANSNTATPLIKGDFSTGLLQLFTPTGTEITGSLTTTGEFNAIGNRGSITISPNYRYISLQDPTDPFGNLVSLYLSGSGIVSKRIPYLQLGDLGLNINDQINVLSIGVQVTGSLIVSGSGATFYNIITLPALSTLPSGVASGSIATSGSNGDLKPYFYNGSTWTALF
jgi:hypothetical protein